MDDEIEGFVIERKGVGHISLDQVDRITFALCHQLVCLQLPVGHIQDGDLIAMRSQLRTLLSAAACQPQNTLAQAIKPP